METEMRGSVETRCEAGNADETCRSPGTVPAYTFDSWGNYISQLPFKFARRFVHQDDEIGTVPLVDLPLPSSFFPTRPFHSYPQRLLTCYPCRDRLPAAVNPLMATRSRPRRGKFTVTGSAIVVDHRNDVSWYYLGGKGGKTVSGLALVRLAPGTWLLR